VSLRCTVCKNPIDEGLNFCPNCRTGFGSQLECQACGRLVPRGSASCLLCSRASGETVETVRPSPVPLSAVLVSLQAPQHDLPTFPPAGLVSLQAPRHAPPALPWMPPHVSLAAPVASRFVVRQGGVEAEVRIPPGDAEVMDLMGQVVVILHTFASKMNGLTGHGELTRHIIRSARVLAADVQEELEQRKGPGR
jgi:RNA polymerase subunit RPABC4/transcription elongation factor Spt4